MGRARRTAVAVLQYFAAFVLTPWIVSLIVPATMPLLDLALDKIPSATRDACAGALLSIIGWLYVKEATAYAIMVACTVGIGWLLVSLASVLSISLWNGVVVFVFICIVGASILYYMTPNGAKLKAAARDRIVASLIKSAPLLQKVLQAIENFQFTSCPPPKERFQSMKDVRKGLVVEHDCGPGWTRYLCRIANVRVGRGGRKVRIINSDGEWREVYLSELSRASVDDIDRFRKLEAEKARQTKGKASKGPLKASHETLQVPDDSSLMCLVISFKKLVSALGIKMSSSNRKSLEAPLNTDDGAICVIGCCITALDKALSIAMGRPRTFDKHLYKAVTKGPKGVAHLLKHARRLVKEALAFVADPDQYAVEAKVQEQEVKPAALNDADDLPKLLDGYTSSDDEEPTTHKCDARASPIKSRRPSCSFRKASSSAVSRALGSCWPFCGSKKSDVLLGGMPKAPDACANCSKPGELSCCACGTTLCGDCSGLDQELIPAAKKKDKKRKNTMFICGRPGCPAGDEAGLRCARCSAYRDNDPSNNEVVVKPLAKSTGVKCDETGRALNCVDSPDYRKLLPPCSNPACPYGGLGDATTLKETKGLRKKRFEIDEILIEVDTNREARVVEPGDGLEVVVIFDGTETRETCATYRRFDRKKVGDVPVDLDLPNLRCRLCKGKVGCEERAARDHENAAAMDELRRQEGGVQGIQRDRSTDHNWQKVDEDDPERRTDFKKVADLYAKVVAAAKPLEEGEEDRVVVELKVGRALSEDLVRGVFPELEEDSEKFAYLVRTIHPQLTGIRQAAETERPFVEGKKGPRASKWFSSLEKLTGVFSSKFTGLPWIVCLFMIPIFTAFMDDHFLLWRTATRSVKYNNRKQAAGMMGFYYILLIALGLSDPIAWTVPLELLGTFLVAIDFDGESTAYRGAPPTIWSTHYTAKFLAIGVRLRLVSMLYSLNVAATCLVCVSGAAIILAGCNFGEIRTTSAFNGAPLVKAPDEDRVGDTDVNRRARGECNAVAYALEKPNYCPDGGAIYEMTVRQGLGTKHAFVAPGDDLPPNYETYDSITFGIAGTDEEHFSSCFADVYENKIGRYLNGEPSGDGRVKLSNYRMFDGCSGSCGGYPFCLGKRDPSGTFDETQPYCGVRRGDWVKGIGRDINSLPLEAKILRRANKAHLLLYSEDLEYDPMSSGLGGDPEYARRDDWVDKKARTLRWKIQSTLGQHAADARVLFMACFAPFLMPRIVAINADQAGARALAEANNIPGMRDRIAGVTYAIGEGANYLKQRLADADGDWSAVVVDARRELHAIAAPHLQMLPDDPFKCAVALKELDATVARELATRRATSAMDVSGDAPRESTPPSSTRSLDPAASPLDSPMFPAGALPTVAAAPRASSDVRSPPRKQQWHDRSPNAATRGWRSASGG